LWLFLTGNNDTGENVIAGVNDTGDKLFAVVNVTDDYDRGLSFLQN
jgi:hypothetical protein